MKKLPMAQSNEPTIDAMNEAIALFDDWVPGYGGEGSLWYSKESTFIPAIAMLDQMKYHASWDWLMPCWKKAGKILFDIRGDLIGENYLDAHRITKAFIDAYQMVEIKNAHIAVYNAIQLISGYNQQKQKDDSAH